MPESATMVADHTAPEQLCADFRESMGRLSAGVVIVTAMLDGRPWGVTISSCTSISASPPLLLISLITRTAATGAITADGRFGVNVLGRSALEAARFGAAPGAPKFVEDHCSEEPAFAHHEPPAIAGAVAHLACVVQETIEVADHTLFIGRAEEITVPDDEAPLAYHQRRFHALGNWSYAESGGSIDPYLDLSLYTC